MKQGGVSVGMMSHKCGKYEIGWGKCGKKKGRVHMKSVRVVTGHLFFHIWREFLPKYNWWRKEWNIDIWSRDQHQDGGSIWFGGRRFEDDTLEEWDKDCAFSCRDLSGCSAQSKEDMEYTYNIDNIDTLSQELSIPWETSKDQPFTSCTTYVGFDWNIKTGQVSLGVAKKDKYLQVVKDWFTQLTHSLKEGEALYGKLLHMCLVIPMGWTYLVELEKMLGIFHSSLSLPHSRPKGLQVDLYWWINKLQQPTISRKIPHPVSLYEAQAFPDVSSKFGITITISDKWRAWCLIPGWRTLKGQQDIG